MITRTTCLTLAAAVMLAGCKTMPTNDGAAAAPAPAPQAAQAPVTGPGGCTYLPGTEPPRQEVSQKNVLIGAAVGALGGALVGRTMSDKKSVGTRNGALLGALAGALAGSQFKEQVKVSEAGDGLVKMNIPGSVMFATGKSDLNPQFQRTLDSVTDSVKTYCGVSAIVVGHTDNTGPLQINEKLSMDRALSVVSYMSARFPRERMSAEGRADREPIAPNNTEQGRAQNRRVEIFIKAPPATAQ